MISNERPSPHELGHGARHGQQPYAPRPFVQEDTIKTIEVQIERKLFVLTLKENPRGRFLRISEEVGGRRNTIIIPATGLQDFKELFDALAKVANENPAKKNLA